MALDFPALVLVEAPLSYRQVGPVAVRHHFERVALDVTAAERLNVGEHGREQLFGIIVGDRGLVHVHYFLFYGPDAVQERISLGEHFGKRFRFDVPSRPGPEPFDFPVEAVDLEAAVKKVEAELQVLEIPGEQLLGFPEYRQVYVDLPEIVQQRRELQLAHRAFGEIVAA